MPSRSDAWGNVEARGLLIDLADRGIEAAVVAGRLVLTPASALTDADRAAIRRHRADLVILALAADERTLARLAALQSGALRPGDPVPGQCSTCGSRHETPTRIGPCGWCRLAEIQCRHWRALRTPDSAAVQVQAHAAVLSPCLLALFPAAIRGADRPALFEVSRSPHEDVA